VDGNPCAQCHAGIAASYAQTSMAHSLAQASGFGRFGDLADRAQQPRLGRAAAYRTFSRDGHWIQQREAGQESDERSIDYVIGSGSHSMTFLHRAPDGQLIELPVSWYSEKGGYWAMSPGYDQARHQDFRRSIGYDCLFCHDGYPDLLLQSKALVEKSIFPGVLRNGIDCQRCHGPGREHIRLASTPGTPLKQIRAAIVNPAQLSRERNMDVCMQCHLETSSMRLPNSVQHYDKQPFSYRAGEALTDYVSYFDRKPGPGVADRFEVAHQAYRLMKSQCFLKSQMTCITCHDPHVELKGAEASEHFVKVCTSCHQNVHPDVLRKTSSTCMDCHMPKRRTEDAVHVIMTDHYIQPYKPAIDLLKEIPETIPDYRGEVVAYRGMNRGLHSALYLAAAQVKQDSNLSEGLPRFEALLAAEQPAAPEFYYMLGAAYYRSGDTAAAIRLLEQSLDHQRDYQPALRMLVSVYERTGDLTSAARAAERAIAHDALDSDTLITSADIALQQGQLAQAQADLGRALTVHEDSPEANNLLGLIELRLGAPDEAEQSFRSALRAEPAMEDARVNLANLLTERGKLAEAQTELERLLAASPKYAPGYHSYAVVLALEHEYPRAFAAMERAIHLEPKPAQYHLDYADLLANTGHLAQAEREYRSTLDLDPSLSLARVGLAGVLLDTGRRQEAERELQAARRNGDPATMAAINQLQHH